ncbi:Uncharacterized protein dnm_006770 [Desulfonema magnum]|uniref:Uncharacterized protein n=1 Tax=Desulfonema magnum TaxID=45655 RepID=A0A975BG49_9BACT|nr:Uncharacterized protein dnm_006770 [Desulfonema magnum]
MGRNPAFSGGGSLLSGEKKPVFFPMTHTVRKLFDLLSIRPGRFWKPRRSSDIEKTFVRVIRSDLFEKSANCRILGCLNNYLILQGFLLKKTISDMVIKKTIFFYA